MELPYAEGDTFAVPLQDGGGFATGLATRLDGNGIVLGYFFGPATPEPLGASSLQGLGPGDAAAVMWFGDLGLIEGSWPTTGPFPGWDRTVWPIPAFGQYIGAGAVELRLTHLLCGPDGAR